MEASDGDPAVVTACEAHAGPLYSYGLWLLADEELTIAALVELFVGAERLGVRLGDPRLSRWLLYAMLRPGCLRASDERGRSWPADVADSFAWTDGLDWAQREVLELSVRHGLDEQDVALVLGVSSDAVRTLLADARTSLDAARAVRTLIPSDCDQLIDRLAAASLTEQGTVVLEHAAHCFACGERLRDAPPIRTQLAHVTTPPTLRPRILRELADNYPGLAEPVAKALGENTPSTRRSEPDPRGPQPLPGQRQHGRRRHVVVMATIVIAAVGVTALLLTGGGNAKSASTGPAMTGAGGTATGPSPGETYGGLTSTSSGVASVPSASRTRGGATTSPTVSTTRTVPTGAGLSPGASASPAGPPSPTPSPATSSGSSLATSWTQNPQTTTITLTATGGAPVQWSVSVSDNYLSVSQPSGMLSSGQSQTVTITVDPSATPKGAWHAKIFVQPGGAVIPVNGKGKP